MVDLAELQSLRDKLVDAFLRLDRPTTRERSRARLDISLVIAELNALTMRESLQRAIRGPLP